MTLIRGLRSYAPCPVCLVPGNKLADLSETFELRTKGKMREIFEQARELNAMDKDELLKEYGLRDIEVRDWTLWIDSKLIFILKNVFWDMNLCDPYQAQSWDGLHAHDSGLFADHIWSEFKRIVGILGKAVAKQIDNQ